MIPTTFLAMSRGALIAIIMALVIPTIIVILHIIQSSKKKSG